MSYNQSRLRRANDRPIARDGDFVLYWMQAFRRLHHNHALDYACVCARELGKPLIVYEGLRFDYPWASERHHRFVLEGMLDNRADAAKLGVPYWPFVAVPGAEGRGLLRSLAGRACLVVTDDWPSFVVPAQIEALARKSERAVFAVDSSCVVPLSLLGAPVSAAAHLRPRIHRAFAAGFENRSRAEPAVPAAPASPIEPPFPVWDGDVDATLAKLPIDRSVKAVPGVRGGRAAARERLGRFLAERLPRYADARSKPASPDDGAASGLSPYLHHGHLSMEEVVEAVLVNAYGTTDVTLGAPGKREAFYGPDPGVNAFLDEAITWRDVGHHWHWHRRQDTESLDRALPAWAKATLAAHAKDARKHLYSAEQWEAAATHDALWNAAQIELIHTGTIHNYLRMLWGKKVIEWSRSPDEAYRTLVHLNNKYALDGRDPNSYTGILWCFGLFDRPWAPEREVLGTVRYMSSDNTAKKFKLDGYLRHVAGLRAAAGQPAGG
jgi:deoxyribodipyrimidine photo-lyase